MPEELLKLFREEEARMNEFLGTCTVGMLPVRVFLLEEAVKAMKASKEFNHQVYHMLGLIMGCEVHSDTVKAGEDLEEVRRRLQVRAMMAEMERERRND